MPSGLVDVSDDLTLKIRSPSARLSPGEAFALAERLIRGATRAMVREEAGIASAVLDVVDKSQGGH